MGLGKRKRVFPGVFFLFFFITASGQVTRNIRFNHDTGSTDFITAADGSVTISYRLPELILKSLKNENGEFYRLSVPGHVSSTETGTPELPVFSRLIALPENRSCRIRISEVKSEKVRPGKIRGILYPAQESQTKTIQRERPEFKMDRKVYSSKGLIKGDTVTIDFLGKSRNSNLGNLRISPVQYNPKSNSLEVITSMKVDVIFDQPVSFRSAESQSSLFSESVMQGVMNYNRDVIPDYTDKPAGMVILTDTSFKKQLQPLIKWKIQKGFRVKILYKGANYAGTSVSQLKDALSKIYNSATAEQPAPDYLLIVGDINVIPCFGTGTTSNYTDMYYGEFTGNGDYIPEMYVGRLPAKDTAEVRIAVNKIIQYEKFSFSKTNQFYRNALATTGYDPDNVTFMNGQVRYLVTNYLTSANNINENHFYYYSGSDPDLYLKKQKDSIIKIINKGTSLVNYSGHGDATGWLHIDIKTPDTALLKNRNMYPVIISNACRTGTFNSETSFGNRLVLKKYGGASAFIGCSNDSYWTEDYYWTVGMGSITENPNYSGKGYGVFDRLFHTHNEFPSDWYYTLGQINYAGNLSVSSSTSRWKKYYWETYNVIGDPSMIPIIGEPYPFKVTIPDTLPNGLKSFTLPVEPFAYVAVSHFDTLWDASFGGVSGGVTLEMPGLSNDSCLIVITGQNRYPVIKTIHFSNIRKEFLNLNEAVVNDQSGNNNRKADFREKLYLSLNLGNMGLSDAHNVYAKLSSSSGWVTIEQDSAFIGTIQSRTSIVLPDKFLVDIADNVPDMGIVSFDLLLKSDGSEKHYPVEITVHSPKLLISSVLIDDTATGNGDHIADPGETFNLIFRIVNEGSSDASGQFSIGSPTGGLNIIESVISNKFLKAQQTTDISLKVSLSDLMSSGNYIQLSSHLESYPFVINRDFTFRIGKIREGFEAMSFNIFPWINTSPVPWTITPGSFYEGAVSARSGMITHNGTSSLIMRTWYPADDTLKFWYKVSCEPTYDYMSFMLNGKELLRKSGDIAWTKAVFPVSKGLNKIEWRYKKDNSDYYYKGEDCAWIDLIDFANAGSVNYIGKDLQVARIVTPIDKNHIGQAMLRVKLLNTGKDTIDGFNLAYSIDNRTATRQHFDDVILPGNDSLEIAFKTKADLSRYGIYNLTVFGYNNGDDYPGNDTLNLEIQNTEITETMILYPNPVIKDFTVFINSKNADRIRLTINNASGAAMYSTERDITSGGNTITLSGAGLAPATYYLNINGKMINRTVPFIKLK